VEEGEDMVDKPEVVEDDNEEIKGESSEKSNEVLIVFHNCWT